MHSNSAGPVAETAAAGSVLKSLNPGSRDFGSVLLRKLRDHARWLGEDIRAALTIKEPGDAEHVLFFPPTGSEGTGSPITLDAQGSLVGLSPSQRNPRVVNDLVRADFGEERELLRRGFHTYLSLVLDDPRGGTCAALFASSKVRRFGAFAIAELATSLAESSRSVPGHTASPEGFRSSVPDLTSTPPNDETVVGESPQFIELSRLIAAVSRQDVTLLIHGENGTGKEILAKAVHRFSPRRDHAFIRVNCAALTETSVESEMFDHRKSAFPRATERHKGKFEEANGGTMLLDEIGSLSLGGQAQLLRVLQEREFEPVGQTTPVLVDVRIIVTTNIDLEVAIEKGSFRPDLYYRLAVVPIRIPPLRERRQDIIPLAEHFLAISLAKAGKAPMILTDQIRRILIGYDWPGNAREVRNVIEYASLTSQGPELRPENLPPALGCTVQQTTSTSPQSMRERLRMHEREIILDAMRQANGVKKDAARNLCIDPRNLGYFLRKHGIR